jgi:hypothetical protein
MATKSMNPPKKSTASAATQPAADGAGKEKRQDSIRLLAYLKWEAVGKPAGVHYWLEAERELRLG